MNETAQPATGVAACPVCRVPSPVPFMEVGPLRYWKCETCAARFLDPAQHPAPDVERAHYLTHENDPADRRYRRFLAKLATPLLARLAPRSSGLDYGCGPGPALAAMLREAGHDMALYDPFFYPDESALTRTYDFIVCTETVEHFHRPAEEFDRLDALLRPGGLLALMTAFRPADDAFAKWHYRKDPTHVVFYNEKTLGTVARARNWTCEFPCPDVALMRKSPG
ncbi:MAG: methyltransferase type 12 [Alphaproteobacteria bacterium HGW-Alphaproteobacteria-11]|nr:MAG: methyltransferase type 12 [Alphaproteobacteria bacterium HGW-Alphaproteobacteria-11]